MWAKAVRLFFFLGGCERECVLSVGGGLKPGGGGSCSVGLRLTIVEDDSFKSWWGPTPLPELGASSCGDVGSSSSDPLGPYELFDELMLTMNSVLNGSRHHLVAPAVDFQPPLGR